HVLFRGAGDQLHFESVAHARLLQIRPEDAVDQPDGGKILDAGEAHRLQIVEEAVRQHEGIRAVVAGEHRRVLDHREHLPGHLHDDVVGIAVGHEARQRSAARHAVAPGIVDDDQVDAARLLRLGGKTRARAAADDRHAVRDLAVKAGEDFGTVGPAHASLSWFSIIRKFSTSAAAKAGSLMWRSSSRSCRLSAASQPVRIASKSARSASGSSNGWPGASMADTPLSGRRKRTGPSIRLRRETMNSPMRRFSSGVVRISVTCALWTWNRRSANCVGTVSRAPKFTMSTAPTDPTYGIFVRIKAPNRSCVAGKTPPTSR